MASASQRVAHYRDMVSKAAHNDQRIATLEATIKELKAPKIVKTVVAPKPVAAPKPAAKVVSVPAADQKAGSYNIIFDKTRNIAIVALLAMKPQPKEVLKILQKRQEPEVFDKSTRSSLFGEDSALKFLGRLTGYTPKDEFSAIQTESWVTRAYALYRDGANLESLNDTLTLRTTIVGRTFSIGDLALWSVLSSNKDFLSGRSNFVHLNRYFSYLNRRYSKLVAGDATKGCCGGKKNKNSGKKDENKDSASTLNFGPEWYGRVVTRFPPEPSGYLHIGHAKAMLHNYETAKINGGKMLLRFDDTNPSKEKAEFEEAIKEDIAKLGVEFASMSYTSDYLQHIQDICTKALTDGHFYIDPRPQAEIKIEREEKASSPFRDTAPEANLELWAKMLEGEEGMVVRAKLVPDSDNGTLRDPSVYRVNLDAHHRTKRQFNVYPTYDLACPIVDSIEGVTHAMRSNEYNERDVQYGLLWDMVCKGTEYNGKKLNKPIIHQFSRLEFIHTVLSKRKLGKIVDKGIVTGWDDPRMPTVRGIIRRGMSIQGLKDYIATQGGSVKASVQHWDKIWALNKHVINPTSGRFWAIDTKNAVPLKLSNAADEGFKNVSWNPTNKELKTQKRLQLAKDILVDQACCGADDMKEGDIVNLNQWGNMKITKLVFGDDGVCKSMEGQFLPEHKKFKGLHRLNWVANCGDSIPIERVELDYLFTCDTLDKDADFWQFVNAESKFVTPMVGEQALRECRKGDTLQLMRRDYCIVDQPYVNDETPMVLIAIPSGKAKSQSKLAQKSNKVAAKNN